MFYHASMLFDHERFLIATKPLVAAMGRGDFMPLYVEVKRTIDDLSESFPLQKYGFGERPRLDISFENVALPLSNANIGRWLAIIMARQLTPASHSIGYNWRVLFEGLRLMQTPETLAAQIIYGRHIGQILVPAMNPQFKDKVDENDPYWDHTRLPYTYRQGGWLSFEDCQYLRNTLLQQEERLKDVDFSVSANLTTREKEYWQVAFLEGFRECLYTLTEAIQFQRGLYSVILWEWEE